jgi:large subunit ribosomal protein L17
MKNKIVGRKFGRKINVRRALLRSLIVNLVRDGKIKTTEAKAKEIRPRIEKMISRARVDNLANKRMLIAKIGESATKKMFEEIAPKYKNRKGGYTRIAKLPARKGDAAKVAIIEFV